MITANQFREAMLLIANYCDQVRKAKAGKTRNEVGCKVKLSAFGKENQKEIHGKAHSKIGAVVDYLSWHGPNDGLVTVKWEGVEKPEIMHVDNVQVCDATKSNQGTER